MRALVLICAAACVSSAPLEAGYGVPLAPVVSLSHQLIRAPPLPTPVLAPQALHPSTFSLPAPVAPTAFAAPVSFVPAPLAPTDLALATAPSSQFHAQDEFGQFSFGYQNINSARVESKDAFGVTHGSYQYVDANGILQTVNYVADPINGFRVAGTNIPVAAASPNLVLPVGPLPVEDTPEVAAARAEHLAAVEAAKAASASGSERKRREANPITGDYEVPLAPVLIQSFPAAPAAFVHSASLHPFHATPFIHNAPVAVPSPLPVFSSPFLAQAHAAAPFLPTSSRFSPAQLQLGSVGPLITAPASLAPLPLAPNSLALASAPSSQFHAQDEFGQFSFGYQNINSARVESKDAFGVTHGSYQYVDANGILQTVNYVADPINGFRVAGTNIPVAAASPNVVLPISPLPVEDTPEVAAAREEHLAAVEAAKAASEE